MPTLKPEQLADVSRLLREGRTTEADTLLNTLKTDLENQAQAEKDALPPPGPKTLAQLQSAWRHSIVEFLGSPRKVESALVELEGAIDRETPKQ